MQHWAPAAASCSSAALPPGSSWGQRIVDPTSLCPPGLGDTSDAGRDAGTENSEPRSPQMLTQSEAKQTPMITPHPSFSPTPRPQPQGYSQARFCRGNPAQGGRVGALGAAHELSVLLQDEATSQCLLCAPHCCGAGKGAPVPRQPTTAGWHSSGSSNVRTRTKQSPNCPR